MALPMGRGDTGQASVTETKFDLGSSGDYARKVTIRNNGSTNILHCLVNTSVATLATEYAAGRTIAVPVSGSSFTFEGEDCGSIRSISYRTDTGTTGFYISAY